MSVNISIITVCLNEIGNIEKTCESIIEQSYDDYEWIVIDGGSNDGTIEYLSNFQDRILHFVSEKDEGIYDAMNKGIKLSSGKYVIFLNGGDYFFSKSSLNIFEDNRTEDLIYGDLKYHNSNDIKKYPEKISLQYFKKNMLPHQAIFYKRDLFDKLGLYDQSYIIAGDYEFNTRIFKLSSPTYSHIEKPITVFRVDGISNNKKFKQLRKKENHKIRYKYFLIYRFSLKSIRQEIRNFLQKYIK